MTVSSWVRATDQTAGSRLLKVERCVGLKVGCNGAGVRLWQPFG